LSNPADYLKPR